MVEAIEGSEYKTGVSVDDISQRLRQIRARSDTELYQEIQRLRKLWATEIQQADIGQPSYRRTPYKAAAAESTDILAAWKKQTLEQIIRFPAPPKPLPKQQYSSGDLFLPPTFAEGATDSLHLDDYTHFHSFIRDAPKYRLIERTSNLLNYPVPKPTFPSFPSSINVLPPKAAGLRWYQYLMIWSQPFLRKAYDAWLRELLADRQSYWNHKNAEFERACRECLQQWEEANTRWDEAVALDKAKLQTLSRAYESGDPRSVADYFRSQLDSIPLPKWCPREYELQFDPQEGILLIDCRLPYLGALALIKTRVLATGPKLVPASQRETRELTNRFLYLIPLRMMWEIPHVDPHHRVRLVCCNGYVIYDDPATGQRRRDVILTIVESPDALETIQLDRVEPEACFRNLKGVAAAKIWELVPVQPLIRFNKDDKRFIASKDVLETLSDSNLATMDWQDFEHLIRELFEREFTGAGGEVRVTQASRDRGVDAVVFDSDPVRGGKLIIQAKRYTNTVDVSAVRDLYGTVINEGANKGILVTTSNYGRDAYEFAKDKPLTLLNGANLLHLLAKHGYKLRIDLDEARQFLK